MSRALSGYVAVALAALAGCLPSSQRQINRSLLPSDSASVALAATAPVDTLALAWSITPPLALATGVAWLHPERPDARLAVVETQAGGIHLFAAEEGRAVGAWSLPEGSFPYLAGTAGDTVVVLARGAARLDWIAGGRVARTVPVPDGTTAVLVRGSWIVARVGGGPDAQAPVLVRLDGRGRVVSRHPIAGAPWRAVGYVRPWGDAVLALSGYRPVADVWTPAARTGAPLDTLALRGLDSPQLARSAQFARGEADQPPLLVASAAALNERLFVLNLRDDRVRVDVYGRDGQIERVLVSPGPPARLDVVAVDLAVRETAGGTVEIAVVSARPAGIGQTASVRLSLYRWRPR